MIAELPESLKEQAIELMKCDRFVEAKALHDAWQAGHPLPEIQPTA